MSNPPSPSNSGSSGQGDIASKSSNSGNQNSGSNAQGAPPSSSESPENEVFARPATDFDPKKKDKAFMAAFMRRLQSGQRTLDLADAAEESVEDEINRQITELEDVRKAPIAEEERKRISDRIRSIREGGWLEGLKPVLVGAKSVPMEYWNRLVAEYENTIAKVAGINSTAERRLAEKDSRIDALTNEVGHANETAATQESLERLQTEEIAALREEVAKLGKTSGPREDTDKDVSGNALTECQHETGVLRNQLNAANAALETARSTASKHYNEVQSLQQQKSEGITREQDLKDEIRRLKSDIAQKNDDSLESNDRIKSLEKKDLEQARNASRPDQNTAAPQTSTKELQTRCAELKAERDIFRDKWAQALVAGNPSLIEYWQAVENTNREINQLYRGIEGLCRAVGINENVVDAPQALDNVIGQVTGLVSEQHQSLQLTVLNLRCALMKARVQNETLQHQLDTAQLAKTDDEIKAELKIVDEGEIEKRVTMRTQTYRDYRRSLLDHIFDAQAGFLALAEKSLDRDAIEALVDQFLQPTTLPAMQLAQGGRQ